MFSYIYEMWLLLFSQIYTMSPHDRSSCKLMQRCRSLKRIVCSLMHTCEYLMGRVCRYSQTRSRSCCQRWSRTGTGTREWRLQPVATTTGCLRSPACPSCPRGLSQRRKTRRQRGFSARRHFSPPLLLWQAKPYILWHQSLSSTINTSSQY